MITSQKVSCSLYCDNCHSLCLVRQPKEPKHIELTIQQDGLFAWTASCDQPMAQAAIDKALEVFPTGSVYCACCGKEWPSLQNALSNGLLRVMEVVTEQNGHVFREVALQELERRKRVSSESGDAVRCNRCGWGGFIPHGEETCPMCQRKGTLEWQHRDMEEATPALGCYVILPKKQ